MASAALGTALRHLRDLFGAGTATGLADGHLLSRYSDSNDEVAFEALVARHGPMVLATCRAVLKSEHDVEDAFQTTFLVLARKARSIKGGDALGGWLHRVAYRAAVQASVEAKKRRRKEAEASAMALSDASGPGLEGYHDFRPILHEEIDRLPESQRVPVVLCDLQGLTYSQAAEQLRSTVPTAPLPPGQGPAAAQRPADAPGLRCPGPGRRHGPRRNKGGGPGVTHPFDGARGDRRPGLGRGSDFDPRPSEEDAFDQDPNRHDGRPGGPRPCLRRRSCRRRQATR